MKAKQIKLVHKVIKGEAFADVVIKNGRIVNVFTDEIEEGKVVAVKGEMIFYVGEEKKELMGKNTLIFDAKSSYIMPGFIDAHTHLDSMIPFDSFVPYSLKGGVTAVISECAMVANACGIKGVMSFIKSTKDRAVKTFFLAPPLVPPIKRFESAHPFSFADFEKLLKRDDFVGIGEAYWNEAVRNEGNYLKKVELAKKLRKTVEGHAAGARGNSLLTYLNCGVTSCHESININKAVEKLKNGVYVMIREGFIRKELDELSKLKDLIPDKRRIILVSDVFNAGMLLKGYMNLVVKRAIELGFSPLDAIKMATINPADYFGLYHLGAIAVGRAADINIVEDLNNMNIKAVFSSGKLVVKEGNYLLPVDDKNEVKPKNSLTLKKVRKEEFYIKRERFGKVRVLEIQSPTITKETFAELTVKDGRLIPDLKADIIPLFLIDRRQGVKNMGKGFIKGTGIKDGAVATTLIWDTCNILALGSQEKDIEIAVNNLIDMGGGIVVVKREKVIFKFPMPLYGLIPLMTVPELAGKEEELETALFKTGCSLQRPFLNLQTIAFTGLPFLRITNSGLVDIKNMKKVPLFLT